MHLQNKDQTKEDNNDEFCPQIKIPATYMRGGTSKGVFFKLEDLPPAAQQPGKIRDQLLLRVIGSPDPYGKQIDGMGSQFQYQQNGHSV